ncbi:hypothetical protein CKO25_01180 [Thiocapsa imhoffii]|uniref:YdbS-like PH domain-containing protein n=1 Tax=Thiocapsa imhoffii TaxID=382777 RepID=A0A9X0WEY5_9GAMM|nr:PH domain-containing protein [Thiocapsa imhoffii]MBK1643286.1 hypothetical protein [Thiocapsa imhoffii]
MSDVFYDAHPSMLRTRPFSTPFMMLALLVGLVLGLIGPVGPLVMMAEAFEPEQVKLVGWVVAGLAALQLSVWWLASRADRLVLRDDEIVWTHGLLNKSYTELKLGSVRTVRVDQSLLQRLLDAGDIKIFTTGDLPELVVRGLPAPNRLRQLIKAS